MKKVSFCKQITISLIASLSAISANAEVTTIEFFGTVTGPFNSAGIELDLPTGAAVGSTIRYSITFDPDAVSSESIPDGRFYTLDSRDREFTGTFQAGTFTARFSDDVRIQVTNDQAAPGSSAAGDILAFQGPDNEASPSCTIFATGGPPTLVRSTRLPDSNSDVNEEYLPAFGSCSWRINSREGLQTSIFLPSLNIETVDITQVYFVNGILTDETTAQLEMYDVRFAVQDRVGHSNLRGVKYDLLYNPDGAAGDLLEVVQQKFSEAGFLFFNGYRVALRVVTDFTNQSDSVQAVVTDSFLDLVANRARSGLSRSMLSRVQREALDRGNNVVLLGYSQGNFYVNEVYDRMSNSEQNRTEVVAVATPAASVAGEGTCPSSRVPWTTDRWDLIRLVPGNCPSTVRNTTLEITARLIDWKAHSFGSYYLRFGFRSREQIVDDLVDALDESDAIGR